MVILQEAKAIKCGLKQTLGGMKLQDGNWRKTFAESITKKS